jgi:hypothetical protein
MIERNIHVVVLDNGSVECVFTGKHITKREFDRVIKVITKNYYDSIRLYRQSRKVEWNRKIRSNRNRNRNSR